MGKVRGGEIVPHVFDFSAELDRILRTEIVFHRQEQLLGGDQAFR